MGWAGSAVENNEAIFRQSALNSRTLTLHFLPCFSPTLISNALAFVLL